MTHPNREELAGRLDKARMGTPYRKRGCRFSSYAVDERDLEAAVAALRQSPTVEETRLAAQSAVVEWLASNQQEYHAGHDRLCDLIAREVDTLYKRGGG